MESERAFAVSNESLMAMITELATLLHSHESMCKWIGAYDESNEKSDEDYVEKYYRGYFEERVSFLVVGLAIWARTLDDRGRIGDYTRFEEPLETEIGKIRINGAEWEQLKDLRMVFNKIVHADEVIISRGLSNVIIEGKDTDLIREIQSLRPDIILRGSGQNKKKYWSMYLDLKAYCDALYRVVESMEWSASESE